MRLLLPLYIVVLFGGGSPLLADCDEVAVSATAVDFGGYEPLSSGPTDSVGTVQITCVGLPGATQNVEILLSSSTHIQLPYRQMQGPASQPLDYNLYLDPSRQVPWADGSSGTATVSDLIEVTVPVEIREYSVYGRIPGGQTPQPGAYTDSLSVTLMF